MRVKQCQEMLDQAGVDYGVAQVKEKFGGLRIYLDYYDSENPHNVALGIAITNYAEWKAALICETCGKYGKLRKDKRWVLTLCDACNEKR